MVVFILSYENILGEGCCKIRKGFESQCSNLGGLRRETELPYCFIRIFAYPNYFFFELGRRDGIETTFQIIFLQV